MAYLLGIASLISGIIAIVMGIKARRRRPGAGSRSGAVISLLLAIFFYAAASYVASN